MSLHGVHLRAIDMHHPACRASSTEPPLVRLWPDSIKKAYDLLFTRRIRRFKVDRSGTSGTEASPIGRDVFKPQPGRLLKEPAFRTL